MEVGGRASQVIGVAGKQVTAGQAGLAESITEVRDKEKKHEWSE